MFMTRMSTTIKKTALLLFLCMATMVTYARKGAEIHLNDTIVTVDTIFKSAPVREFTLAFKNKGKEPLVITEVSTDCPCTTVTFVPEPVMPRNKGMLRIKLDLTGFLPGKYEKKIRIASNSSGGDVTIVLHTMLVYD